MIVLGIDPGLTGGLALIKSGERPRVIAAVDIPVVGENAKRRVDVLKVIKFLQKHSIAHGFIERAQAMPDQGASSGFIYGRAVGALEACVQGMQIPMTVVEASAWKKANGLLRPNHVDKKQWSKIVKKASRQRALQLFPEAEPMMSREMDHGRAEAALIARFGLILLGQEAGVSPNPQAAE